MKIDLYTRGVLTIIAVALIYLCMVLTPLPTVSAQRGLRPGDDTGPAQVVVVGWRTTDRPAVELGDGGPVRVRGEVSVDGLVETRQTANSVSRVVLVGWEKDAVFGGPKPNPGQPRTLSDVGRGFPVTETPRQ